VGRLSESLQAILEKLQDALNEDLDSTQEQANFIRDVLLPAMNTARTISDELEELIPDDIWMLPSYTEMLFIRELAVLGHSRTKSMLFVRALDPVPEPVDPVIYAVYDYSNTSI
jgi:hypothetical protein